MFKNYAFLILTLSITACGFDSTQELSFEMYGVYTTPTDATGDTTPQSITMNLAGVTLVAEGGVDQTDLYTGAQIEYDIVDRPQVIFKQDLADYEDLTFSQTILTFDTNYTLNIKDGDPITGQLASGALTYDTPLVIETGKDISFSIKVSWQNIVQDGAIVVSPSFEFIKD